MKPQVFFLRLGCKVQQRSRQGYRRSGPYYLVQINVIRCKSIIMQMTTNAQRMFMSLQRIFIVVQDSKSNRQTFNLSLFIFHYIYCINSLGPNFGIFNSLYKVKHINSTRKRVQSETQRKIHRKPAQFFENSTKLCEIYIDRSVKSRHFETELNMSLEHSTLGVRNCACTPDLVPRACDPREGT